MRIAYIAEVSSRGSGFTCMHGSTECAGDIQQMCIMKYLPPGGPLGKYHYFDFLECVGPTHSKIPTNTDQCLKKIGATNDLIQKVHTCAEGSEGDQMMADSIKYTLARCGHHPHCRSCTMWMNGKQVCIHDDGKWYDCPIGHTVDEWVKAICDAYTGPNKPKACQRVNVTSAI